VCVSLEVPHHADDLEPRIGFDYSRDLGFMHEAKATTERGTVAEVVLREDLIDDDRGRTRACVRFGEAPPGHNRHAVEREEIRLDAVDPPPARGDATLARAG
jgi:hypothetical protein